MDIVSCDNGIISEGQLRDIFSHYNKEGWLNTFLAKYNGSNIYVLKETDITVRFSFDGDSDIYYWIIVEAYADENGNEDLLLIQMDTFDYNLTQIEMKKAV